MAQCVAVDGVGVLHLQVGDPASCGSVLLSSVEYIDFLASVTAFGFDLPSFELAFGGGLVVFAVGLGVGLVLSVIRKTRF